MIFAQSYKNLSYLQKKKENFSSFIKEKQYLCTLIIKKYDMPQSLHIAIIGGGAAGFFAAKCSTSMPSPAASICRPPGPQGMWWDNISENKRRGISSPSGFLSLSQKLFSPKKLAISNNYCNFAVRFKKEDYGNKTISFRHTDFRTNSRRRQTVYRQDGIHLPHGSHQR